MIKCRKCGQDLLDYAIANTIAYCPNCGAKILKKTRNELFDAVNREEVEGIIKENLLEALDDYEGETNDLDLKSFADESANGAFFCSNYKGRLFVARHYSWFLDCIHDQIDNGILSFGGIKSYRLEADYLLVGCFIEATGKLIRNLELPERITNENRAEVIETVKKADNFLED